MVNRSYNHRHHHHRNTGAGNHTRTTKTFFLPMFCRLSINDVAKPTKLADDLSCSSSLSSSTISSSPDPISPKISCIGQIKKRSINNTTTATSYHLHLTTARVSAVTTGKSTNKLNYAKLRKLFSGKNLISPQIDSTTINSHVGKCITSNRNWICNANVTKRKLNHVISIEDPVVVVEELDPPLPVVKFRPSDQKSSVNLRKRRGIELKTLQIQPFQLSTTVHSTKTKLSGNRDLSLQTTLLPHDGPDQSIR